MTEYEEAELSRLIEADEISDEEVAEMLREDKRRNDLRREEYGEDA